MSYQSNINKMVGAIGGAKVAANKKNMDQERLQIQAQNADTQAKYAETLSQKYALEEHKLQIKEQQNKLKTEQNKLIQMQEKSRQKANNIMLANIKQVTDLKQQRRLLKDFTKQFQEVKKGGEISDNKE